MCIRDRRGILGDYRPGAGIRLGPHFFSTDDEIRLAVEQMSDVLQTGAWQPHAGALAKH